MDILICSKCRLIFRWPPDTAEDLNRHYESEFAEEAPQVKLPDPASLPGLKAERFFSLFGPDFEDKLRVLQSIRPSGRLLDFGCSWGYTSWLMAQAGYDVVGFEISRRRAEYAQNYLGLPVACKVQGLDEHSFDIIFSHNVLEHLSGIRQTLGLFAKLLKPGGLGIHILPNFSGLIRCGQWIHLIGEDHPVAPTVEFFEYALPKAGLNRFNFASSPLDDAALRRVANGEPGQMEGDELLIVAGK